MNVRPGQSPKLRPGTRLARRQAKGRNTFLASHSVKQRPNQARRSSTGERKDRLPFAPPEDWYEPTDAETYRIVVQDPGPGYRHVVTPAQIRERLSRVPQQFLEQ